MNSILHLRNLPGFLDIIGDNSMRWILGDDSKIKFWTNLWYLDVKLCVKFPILYAICRFQSNSVAFFIEALQLSAASLFRRRLWVWEEALLSELQLYLVGICLHQAVPDRRCWAHSRSGKSTSKRAYDLLYLQSPRMRFACCNAIWKLLVPPKVQCFAWLAVLDSILCKEFLVRRWTSLLWSNILSWWGVYKPMHMYCFGL